MGKRIEDLANVETEHLLGIATGLPLVTLRVESTGTVLLGHLSPEQAREIATHLFESAARAEYEHDLLTEMQRNDWTEDLIGGIFRMVRAGEMTRQMKGFQ